MKFVLASHNKGKLAEMQAILGELGVEVVMPSDVGVDVDVEETGTTFAENAALKANAVMAASGLPAIADDSGLCVDWLQGAPGVYSARYGGLDSDPERCRLLLHVVDVSGCEGRDPKADFEQINHELAGFSAELADRPQIVLGNKCDIASPEQVEEFKQYVEAKGLTFLPISAATRQGVDNLPALVYNRLKDLPPVKVYEAEYKRPDKNAQPTRPFTVERTGDHEFTVDAPWLERILAGTNVEDYESLQYFQTQLGDSGILDELVAQGVEEEDTIKIGEYEFDYLY